MKKKAEIVLEALETGGSFVRNPDGSLTRVEHPPEAEEAVAAEPDAPAPPADPASGAPADPAPQE